MIAEVVALLTAALLPLTLWCVAMSTRRKGYRLQGQRPFIIDEDHDWITFTEVNTGWVRKYSRAETDRIIDQCIGLTARDLAHVNGLCLRLSKRPLPILANYVLAEAQARTFRLGKMPNIATTVERPALLTLESKWMTLAYYTSGTPFSFLGRLICAVFDFHTLPDLRDPLTYPEKALMGYISKVNMDNLPFMADVGYCSRAVVKSSVRELMPALTTSVLAAPISCHQNIMSSVTGRVVGPSVQPHPLMSKPMLQKVGPNKTPVSFVACPGQGYGYFSGKRWIEEFKGYRDLGVRADYKDVVKNELASWDRADAAAARRRCESSECTSLTPAKPCDECVRVTQVPRMIFVPTPDASVNFSLWIQLLPYKTHGQWWSPTPVLRANGEHRFRTCDGRTVRYGLEDRPGLHNVLKTAYYAFRACHPWHPPKGLLEPLSFQEWVRRYDKSKREQLSSARDDLRHRGPVASRDLNIKNFVKIETSSNATTPRNISPRKDHVLCVLGPHVSAIEHLATASPYLVKGLSPSERDAKMAPLLNYGQVLELDHSRFDKHISAPILRSVERVLLTDPFSTRHYLYHQVVEKLTKTRGLSRYGTRYAMPGTRASGDAHTSISNGEINAFLIWSALCHGQPFHAFCEGDDCVVGVARRQNTDHVDAAMAALGFNIKRISHDSVDGAMFCGRILCMVEDRIVSMCDIIRTLIKFHTSTSDKSAPYLVCAKALSYYFTDGHTPLVGVLSRSLVRCLLPKLNRNKLRRVIKSSTRALPWFLRSTEYHINDLFLGSYDDEPMEELRVRAAINTGLTVALQRKFEDEYRLFEQGYLENVTKIEVSCDPAWIDCYVDRPLA